MAAILRNGGHIEKLHVPHYFHEGRPLYSMRAKTGACIMIWRFLHLSAQLFLKMGSKYLQKIFFDRNIPVHFL